MIRSRTLLRRVRGAIVVVAIALGAIVGTTTTASAEQACGPSTGESVACLFVTNKGAGIYNVHIGIDVFLPFGEPARIVAQPGDAFSALLMGRDDDGDDVLAAIPLIVENGFGEQLSADFDRDVGTGVVNEDSGSGKGDELVARITLFDRDTNTTTVFESPILRMNI